MKKLFNWVDESPHKQEEPSSSKKLLGFIAGERPLHKYFNWLYYIALKWINFLNSYFNEGGYAAFERVLLDASSGNINYSLPNGVDGKTLSITRTDTSTNTVTLIPYGTQTIEGNSTYDVTYYNRSVTITFFDDNWCIFDKEINDAET